MKEEEFLKKTRGHFINIPLNYTLDGNDNVILDEESMQEEFDYGLQKVKDILNKDDFEKGELD